MDHLEILEKMQNGAKLEIMSQARDEPLPAAFLDGDHVSVSQAVRASNSHCVEKIASASNWSAYSWIK